MSITSSTELEPVKSNWWFFALAGSLLVVSSAPAASIHLAVEGSDAPLVMSPGSSQTVTLTLANEGIAAVQLLAAQVKLYTQGQTGLVTIDSVAATPQPLFSPSTPLLVQQAGMGFVSDAGMFPATLGPQNSSAFVDISLSVSEDASGLFYLLMQPYEVSDFNSSGFLAFEGMPVRMPYSNNPSPEFENSILLAIIDVSSLPGDYDGNGIVETADYSMWRSNFGMSVSPFGSGADGNHDGMVNIADYTIWRDHLGATNIPSPIITGLAQVPEPRTSDLILCLLCCSWLAFPLRQYFQTHASLVE